MLFVEVSACLVPRFREQDCRPSEMNADEVHGAVCQKTPCAKINEMCTLATTNFTASSETEIFMPFSFCLTIYSSLSHTHTLTVEEPLLYQTAHER